MEGLLNMNYSAGFSNLLEKSGLNYFEIISDA